MVLHNSKWDKKATRRYLKKHGLNGKKTEQDSNDLEDQADSVASDVEGTQNENDSHSDNSDNELNNSQTDPKATSDTPPDITNQSWKNRGNKYQLQSNIWRYQKKSVDDQLNELLAESAALASENGEVNSIAQTALKKRIDEIRSKKESQESNLDFFPDEDENDEYNEEYSDLIRSAAMKADTKLPFNKSLDDSNNKKSHIKLHDDPEEFHRLQKEIDHSKLVNDIKKRFGPRMKKANKLMNPKDTDEDDFESFLNDVDKLQVEGLDGDERFISENDGVYSDDLNELDRDGSETNKSEWESESESRQKPIDKKKEEYLDFLLS